MPRALVVAFYPNGVDVLIDEIPHAQSVVTCLTKDLRFTVVETQQLTPGQTLTIKPRPGFVYLLPIVEE